MITMKGAAVSAKLKEQVEKGLETLTWVPKLTIIRVGENPDDISIENVLRQALTLIATMPLTSVYAYHAYQHYHRYRSYGEISKSSERHSMCSRIRNLHTGAGKKNGRSVRRCHCRICDREALWCLRQRLRAEGEGLCERDEGCDQISSRLKLEHRSQSVIKICFIPKKG